MQYKNFILIRAAQMKNKIGSIFLILFFIKVLYLTDVMEYGVQNRKNHFKKRMDLEKRINVLKRNNSVVLNLCHNTLNTVNQYGYVNKIGFLSVDEERFEHNLNSLFDQAHEILDKNTEIYNHCQLEFNKYSKLDNKLKKLHAEFVRQVNTRAKIKYIMRMLKKTTRNIFLENKKRKFYYGQFN